MAKSERRDAGRDSIGRMADDQSESRGAPRERCHRVYVEANLAQNLPDAIAPDQRISTPHDARVHHWHVAEVVRTMRDAPSRCDITGGGIDNPTKHQCGCG
jgi:hypothetical protein